MEIDMFGNNEHCQIWKKGKTCKPENTTPAVKDYVGSITLWGVFLYSALNSIMSLGKTSTVNTEATS